MEQIDLVKEDGIDREKMISMGPYIKDVRKILGILDPLPPLVRFSRNLSELSYEKLVISLTPPPPQRVRTLWMVP